MASAKETPSTSKYGYLIVLPNGRTMRLDHKSSTKFIEADDHSMLQAKITPLGITIDNVGTNDVEESLRRMLNQ